MSTSLKETILLTEKYKVKRRQDQHSKAQAVPGKEEMAGQ